MFRRVKMLLAGGAATALGIGGLMLAPASASASVSAAPTTSGPPRARGWP